MGLAKRRPFETRIRGCLGLDVPATEEMRLLDRGCESTVGDQVERHDGCCRGREDGERKMRMVSQRVACSQLFDVSSDIEAICGR
jgi:hypothetical protein